MSEENIILHSSNCTLTWDFVRHQASTWRLQGIDNVFDVFSFSNYVFYIGEEGVFGVEQPPFQPTERDCIPLPSPDVNTLTPFLFLPHQRKHVNIKRTSGPDSCNPHFRDYQTSLIYEIIETEESNGDPYGPEPVIKTIYRYHFHFNSSNPAKSSLDLIEASTVCRPQTEQPPETPHILHLHPYQHFNGRLGAIWAEEAEDEEYAEWSTTSIFFSLSSRFDPASAKLAFSGSEGSSTVVPDPRDLQLVRFWDKPDPVEEDSDTEEYEDPLNALTCEFCPHTGRVAVLWENANVGVTQVTLYDFLA
ncbi:hypothetical protein EST38_g3657 [Candolleomyces aberdarensis]|uniref:Uncharacterized protein n=1 Tax=Candolleomyces aberdarensis TaxID=2316362 RepID=A0A4Q2DRQ5_9AGAR|nr:hypothetical protein EST38_g3657 [Candolleomyces aberdarensis]